MTDSGATPADLSRYRPHRVISVHVETLAIEDGHTPLPVVGKPAALVLGFRQADATTPPQLVTTHHVWVEPVDTRPPPQGKAWTGPVRDEPPRWPTRLTGDGWTASWTADHPTAGQLELQGTITGDWSYGVPELIRGHVLRVQRVTQTRHRVGPGPQDWQEIPDATTLKDLDPTETAVRFNNGRVLGTQIGDSPYYTLRPPERVWTYDTGLLVDLDLDLDGASTPRLPRQSYPAV